MIIEKNSINLIFSMQIMLAIKVLCLHCGTILVLYAISQVDLQKNEVNNI